LEGLPSLAQFIAIDLGENNHISQGDILDAASYTHKENDSGVKVGDQGC